ncbi:MAG: amino acid adenylation domain-containing protein, partial [Verrucomicrobia bacterium]|nr:amino acid adenylation domain-containing protein [Verrucomicrobiota bacterium]
VHRNTDLPMVLLGVLRAGGCYVPLDPDDPPDRIARTVAAAGCARVLGHESLISGLGSVARAMPGDVRWMPVESLFAPGRAPGDAAAVPTRSPPDAPGGRRLAYVLFTSGSTGEPKGVEVEHRSVVNLLAAVRQWIGFAESDRYLAISTLAFDISVAELFLPLIAGGQVVLRDRSLLLEPRRLAQELRQEGITVFQTGPSVWSLVLAEVPDFPRLRVAVTTGEAIAPALARRLASVGDSVWNLYGPTETTVWATGFRLEARAEETPCRSPVSAPIGRPLTAVEALVLDEHQAPVPDGAEGELWIGGDAVARGYRGKEALTRERFTEPFPGAGRCYRTGDLVVRDAEGVLHYLGRNDDQIKVHGVRIEPMEVEAALLRHPGIAQAAATWYATTQGPRSLVAAVVARPGGVVTSEDLRQHLARLLPSAMIPSRFVVVGALPLTASGKVDRKAIRARATASAPVTSGTPPVPDAAGITPTERTLIQIWEQTLNIRPVGRHDHFFSVGGDSLSAVTMILEVESVFGISITVRLVFEAPTLSQLAARVDRVRECPDDLGNGAFVFPLSQQGRRSPVFFSNVDLRMARRGLWAADCPLYAVSQWAQGSGFVQARSMADLAEIHLKGIRAVQPRGPYRLAGYSFGGLIALEIAHQLRRNGEEVELLFLLDPSEPTDDPLTAAVEEGRRSRDRNARGLRDRLLAWTPRWLRDALAGIRQWTVYHLVHLHGRHPNPVSTRLLPGNRWPAFWYAARRLSRSYVPRPYEGPVLAVFTADHDRQSLWKPFLGPAAVSRVMEARHLELFDDPSRSLWMEMLRARLEAEEPSRGPSPTPTPKPTPTPTPAP